MNPNLFGKDVAEIIGNNYPEVGIKVSPANQADALMKKHRPDVCIIATRSTVAELEEIFTICARNGVNAITTCEEALYPWNSSPDNIFVIYPSTERNKFVLRNLSEYHIS